MKTLRASFALSLFVLLLAPGVASATDTLDQHQTNYAGGLLVTSTDSFAQTFTAGLSGGLDRVELYLYNVGATGDLKVEIRGVESTGAPSATTLASETVLGSSIPELGGWVPVTFVLPAQVVAGTQYAIVAYRVGGVGVQSGAEQGNPYPSGSFWLSQTSPPTTWEIPSLLDGWDLAFQTYVAELPTSKEQCKGGGWQNFGATFKNQGQCVSFVATGGKHG